MKVSKIALGAALALGGSAVLFTTPVDAQRAPRASAQAQPPQVQSAGRTLQLSREERAALVALQTAVANNDQAAALAALPAAQAAAQGADARYAVAQFQLRLGIDRQDVAMQSDAIDAMIASGGAPEETLSELYRNQAALAAQQGDLEKADQALTRLLETSPNDPELIAQLAEVRNDRNQHADAVQLIQRAIQAMQSAGQTVPENWYKRGLKIAYDGQMNAQSMMFSRELVAAYPTPENWRDAMLIYREVNQLDEPTSLDLFRLQRATNALGGERDYFEMAETLNTRGYPGEADAVLRDGISSNMIDGNKAAFRELRGIIAPRLSGDREALAGTEAAARSAASGTAALNLADAYYGYADYPKAATFYRVALEKGGVDANLVNTRLGAALAQGGQRAEAEAAFRAVTGPRQDLAAYWLLWLGQRS